MLYTNTNINYIVYTNLQLGIYFVIDIILNIILLYIYQIAMAYYKYMYLFNRRHSKDNTIFDYK